MSGAAPPADGIARLRGFVADLTRLVAAEPDAAACLSQGAALLAALVATDDWLPDAYAVPHPHRYQQFLLHCDPLERFSVVSFVWGPGQRTPVHDHRVWGLVGVLRGGEVETRYVRDAAGRLVPGPVAALSRGDVALLSPEAGDLHQVANAFDDRVSVSVHLYGGDIGAVRRATYDPASGAPTPFVSGYANAAVPNLWGRPAEPASS